MHEAEAVFSAIERLPVEFHRDLSRATVERVVQRCRDDLDTASQPWLPELIERVGRQRLTTLVDGCGCTMPDAVPA